MIYLDTSALVKLHLWESNSADVQNLISQQDHPLPIWELQEMELINALRLKVFWGDIVEADARKQLDLFEARKQKGHYYFPDIDRSALWATFQRLSIHTMQLECRTLDILHVACASLLEPELFVSYDERQRKLAEIAGLRINVL